MKKWLTGLLLVIAAAGMIIPCCGSDNCCADQPAVNSSSESNQDEGICSPFFACTTCPGFVSLSRTIHVVEQVLEKHVHHEDILQFNLATYTTSFWQPPRHLKS